MTFVEHQLVEIFNIEFNHIDDAQYLLDKHRIENNISSTNYLLMIRFKLNNDNMFINKFRMSTISEINTLIKFNKIVFENRECLITFFKDFQIDLDRAIEITKPKLIKIENIINQIKLSSRVDEKNIDYELCNLFLNDYSRHISTFDNIAFNFAQVNNSFKQISVSLNFVNIYRHSEIPLSLYKYISYKNALRQRINSIKAKTLKLI